MKPEKPRESSQDLLNYAQAMNWLKTTFPEDQYSFRDAAKEIASEVKRRVAPPKTLDEGGKE